MDLDDFTPADGGSLRGQPVPEAEPVATFTQTQTVHPDSCWHPLGGELDPGRAPSRAHSAQNRGGPGSRQTPASPAVLVSTQARGTRTSPLPAWCAQP
jgi:hypothetical protein